MDKVHTFFLKHIKTSKNSFTTESTMDLKTEVSNNSLKCYVQFFFSILLNSEYYIYVKHKLCITFATSLFTLRFQRSKWSTLSLL